MKQKPAKLAFLEQIVAKVEGMQRRVLRESRGERARAVMPDLVLAQGYVPQPPRALQHRGDGCGAVVRYGVPAQLDVIKQRVSRCSQVVGERQRAAIGDAIVRQAEEAQLTPDAWLAQHAQQPDEPRIAQIVGSNVQRGERVTEMQQTCAKEHAVAILGERAG